MEIELNYPRKDFEKELDSYIDEGNNLTKKYKNSEIKPSEFKLLEREYNYWDEEVREFLRIRLDTFLENKFLDDFKNVSNLNLSPIIKKLSGIDVDILKSEHEFLLTSIQKKIDVLVLLKRKLKFINENELYTNLLITNQIETMNKIFISHSSLDSKYVEKIIDILETIGVQNDRIFCSSFEGYAVKLGNDFLEEIKNELNNQVLVIFVLSTNFYSSVVCLCEMGATWVKTNKHIPILIPPFDYSDIKGVIPTTNGMKINEKVKYNSLKTVIEEFLEIKPINISVWERKRDNVLKDLKVMLDSSINSNENLINKKANISSHKLELDYYKNVHLKIKDQSVIEWPDDFEMQLNYIENQTRAVEKLINHNPIDIDAEKFKIIREKGRKEWKEDFEMQLDYEKRQVESLRRLNQI